MVIRSACFVGGARVSYPTTSPPSNPSTASASEPAIVAHMTREGASKTPHTAPVSALVIVVLLCAQA